MATGQGVPEEQSVITEEVLFLEDLRGSLHALNLACNVLGDCLIVMESEITMILSGEPYVAFMLLFNMKTGKFFGRIWNETTVSGKAVSVKEVSEACITFFKQGKPCLGCPIDDADEHVSDEFIISHIPIKRKYSKVCHRVVPSDITTCSECLKLETCTQDADGIVRSSLCENDLQLKYEDSQVCADKPHLTYAQLIEEALLQADDNTLSLRDIYRYLKEKYPYFRHNANESSWKSSIRNNLSQHSKFKTIPIVPGPSNGFKCGKVWRLLSNATLRNGIVEIVEPQEQKYPSYDHSCQSKAGEEYIEMEEVVEDVDSQDLISLQYEKPSKTYSQLIAQALNQADNGGLTVGEICSFISQQYSYYSMEVGDWQDAVERQLSERKIFLKVKNDGYDESRWILAPDVLRDPKDLLIDCKGNQKPKLKLKQIIEDILAEAEGKQLRLRDIFRIMMDKYPYYKTLESSSWQNYVRFALCRNPRFRKVPGKMRSAKVNQPDVVPRASAGQLLGNKVRPKNISDEQSMSTTENMQQRLEPKNAKNISEGKSISTVENLTLRLGGPKTQKIFEESLLQSTKVTGWQQTRPFPAEKEMIELEKPPFTYAELILQAFQHSGCKVMTLKEICRQISRSHAYYNFKLLQWKEAVYVTLGKSSVIKRIGRNDKSSLWKVIDGTEVECPKCNRLFQCDDEEYYNHMRLSHFYGKFTCPAACDIIAECAKDLIDHMQQEGHQVEHFAKCPLCEELIPIQELEPHYVTCVSAKKKKDRCMEVCPTCGKQVSKSHRQRHRKLHLPKENLTEKTPTYYYCDQCEKKYSDKNRLTDHFKAEHLGIVVQCQLCPETFKTRQEQWSHKNLVHSTDERYQCKYCGLRMGTESKLRVHVEGHEDPKFQCEKCGKKLLHMSSLRLHEKIHTGERPFQCTEENCGKWWKCRSSLAKHKRQIHKIIVPGKKKKMPKQI